MSEIMPSHGQEAQIPRGVATIEPLERETIRRVAWRLLPLIVLGWLVNFLDRTNIGFAALTMNKAIGLTATTFGFGAGLFYVGYLLFEVPSNLMLAKVGARLWLARILFTWGIVSGLTAFIWNDWSFYAIRVLLGVAEAGFLPGALIYLTWWFPSHYRARMVAIFLAAQPLSLIIGPPLSSACLLGLDGLLGFQGWQWLFLVESVPPIVMSFVFLALLTDRPSDAKWLSPEQANWLQRRMESEREQREAVHRYHLGEALINPRVWAFVAVWFFYCAITIVVPLFLPQIIRALGVSIQMTAFASAVPFVFALAAMLYFSSRSDYSGNRTRYAATALVLASVGPAAAAIIGINHPILMLVALTVGIMGAQSVAPLFWPIPTAMLSGLAAAGSVALINSVGNVAGLIAPTVFGIMKDATGSDMIAVLTICPTPLISVVILLLVGHDRRTERIPSRG